MQHGYTINAQLCYFLVAMKGSYATLVAWTYFACSDKMLETVSASLLTIEYCEFVTLRVFESKQHNAPTTVPSSDVMG